MQHNQHEAARRRPQAVVVSRNVCLTQGDLNHRAMRKLASVACMSRWLMHVQRKDARMTSCIGTGSAATALGLAARKQGRTKGSCVEIIALLSSSTSGLPNINRSGCADAPHCTVLHTCPRANPCAARHHSLLRLARCRCLSCYPEADSSANTL